MNEGEKGSTFRILMVDDDSSIRDVGRRILEH